MNLSVTTLSTQNLNFKNRLNASKGTIYVEGKKIMYELTHDNKNQPYYKFLDLDGKLIGLGEHNYAIFNMGNHVLEKTLRTGKYGVNYRVVSDINTGKIEELSEWQPDSGNTVLSNDESGRIQSNRHTKWDNFLLGRYGTIFVKDITKLPNTIGRYLVKNIGLPSGEELDLTFKLDNPTDLFLRDPRNKKVHKSRHHKLQYNRHQIH